MIFSFFYFQHEISYDAFAPFTSHSRIGSQDIADHYYRKHKEIEPPKRGKTEELLSFH